MQMHKGFNGELRGEHKSAHNFSDAFSRGVGSLFKSMAFGSFFPINAFKRMYYSIAHFLLQAFYRSCDGFSRISPLS